MNRILKMITVGAIILLLLGMWTILITEKFYRYGYHTGRTEYLMEDKERYGIRDWLEKHPEDSDKFLGKGKSIDDIETVVKHPTFWTDLTNWWF